MLDYASEAKNAMAPAVYGNAMPTKIGCECTGRGGQPTFSYCVNGI
jgi:hypothetical protein